MNQQATTDRVVNGVPVDQLVETMGEIRRRPAIAKFTFRANNRWEDGGRNIAQVSNYDGACQFFDRDQPHSVLMDEPPVLLSGDKAANPVEVLLAALGGCLTTSLVYHAAAMGVTVESVESSYEGDLDLHGFLGMDDSVRNGYQGIRVTFRITAPGASEQQLDDLVRVARERSPVFDVISNGTPVQVVRAA